MTESVLGSIGAQASHLTISSNFFLAKPPVWLPSTPRNLHPYMPSVSHACLQMWWPMRFVCMYSTATASPDLCISYFRFVPHHSFTLPLFTSFGIPNPQNMNFVTADVLLVVCVCLHMCETALCAWKICSLCLSLPGSHCSPDNAGLICTWHTDYTCANMGRHPLRRAQGARCCDEGGDELRRGAGGLNGLLTFREIIKTQSLVSRCISVHSATCNLLLPHVI